MNFGYARVSTKTQDIERQIRNIFEIDKNVKIYKEAFTGTKIEGRREFNKLIKEVKTGDTIIFDSVSRMSRSADEGTKLYFELMNRGVKLVFLKEPYINTEVYKKALDNEVKETGNDIADIYIKATNRVLKLLAEKQIKIAFEQAEKEVLDLRQRTSEGIETARREGKQVGQPQGAKLTTKKSIEMKEKMKKLLSNHKDKEVMSLLGIARNTYYKYKKELQEEEK